MSVPNGILIFDLDGTLVDSMGPAADLFCEMLSSECSVSESVSRPIFTSLLGQGPKAQFAAVLQRLEVADDALVENLTRRYWQLDEAHVPALFPEVLDMLTNLHREGHTLIVSTGSIPTSAIRKTREAGIEGLFNLILGSDEDVPGLAKGPGHFALIADVLAVTPQDLQTQAVFIGDGVYDMQVARDAGIRAVGRLTGGNGDALLAAGAHHLIADLRELPRLLASL